MCKLRGWVLTDFAHSAMVAFVILQVDPLPRAAALSENRGVAELVKQPLPLGSLL